MAWSNAHYIKMNNIPIFLYHDIFSKADKPKDNFAVTLENFKAQMDYLHQNGFIAVSLEKMVAELEYWKSDEAKDSKLPKDMRKKVVLTFDDGDFSNFNLVLPVLKDKGFSATFFITVNEIGKEGRMDWQMVYELSRQGMGIGSHGLNHSFLTGLNNYTVLNELLLSKQVLEKYIRKRVDFLSIPQGFYNKRILAIARDVGFKAVCISDIGFNDFSAEELFLLQRFTIRKNYGMNIFRSIAAGDPLLMVNVLEKMRSGLRNVLGYQVYDRLRRLKHNRVKPEV